ncbi:hypothetical protein K432DRAFT_57258 [Lepidopterella palustris CBS 459.81]|uniref:Uncharacterized protein n=1 Tax=Lepidopterella palustris CBS 459.81 TaxID=1314670 RepID=A0A8E2EA87_9PEZI|nr:hypothetical protein K432DRAFT_57258 [Lepidopterella palustris CBS 459.81]
MTTTPPSDLLLSVRTYPFLHPPPFLSPSLQPSHPSYPSHPKIPASHPSQPFSSSSSSSSSFCQTRFPIPHLHHPGPLSPLQCPPISLQPSQLQSSLRNALSTYGASSPQYHRIKAMVDEEVASAANPPQSPTQQFSGLQSSSNTTGMFSLAYRPKPSSARKG